MDDLRELFELTAAIAADFYDTLPDRPVCPPATVAELHAALSSPLPEHGLPARTNRQTSEDDVERTLAAFRKLAPV